MSPFDPLPDVELVERAAQLAEAIGGEVEIDGAIPGTAPVSVSAGSGRRLLMRWPTQARHNSQLNVRKLKRLKMWLALRQARPDLSELSISELCAFLASERGTALVLSYGDSVPLRRCESCPLCGGRERVDMLCESAQPVIGYLTRDSRHYRQCVGCGLVYLDPMPADLAKLYDAWDSESAGPPSRTDYETAKLQTTSYFANFDYFLSEWGPELGAMVRIVDCGGGAGHFSALAKSRFPGWRVESLEFEQRQAPMLESLGVVSLAGDLLAHSFEQGAYDAVTAWEVIEHLPPDRLHGFFQAVHRALRPGGFFVVSTPDFAAAASSVADFWAAFLPHHLTVLSWPIIESLAERSGLSIVGRNSRSLATRQSGYASYAARAGATRSVRGTSEVLARLLSDPAASKRAEALFSGVGGGSELIAVMRRL